MTLAGATPAAALGTQVFAASLTASTITGEKPQAKLWYHDGSWWAILRGPSGLAFYEKVGDAWYRCSFVDAILTSNGAADVQWDGTRLHVLEYSSTPLYFEYTYDSSLRVWNLVTGFPVTAPKVTGSETMVLDIDSTGRAWATAEGNLDVNVWYTTTADRRTWTKTPIILRSGLDADDITSVIAFGGDKIGVFWSDQTRDEFGFCVHRDVDPPDSWQPLEVASSGPGHADDHIHLTADSQGRVYALTKDDFDRQCVQRRDANGQWTVKSDVTGSSGTRGIIMLSEADSKAYILWTDWVSSPDIISYRSADLATLDFGATTTLISASGSLNNVSSTKQLLPTGCLMAVAEGAGGVWANGFGNPVPGNLPPPAAPENLTAQLLDAPLHVDLAWSPPSTGTPDGYDVYRQVDGGSFIKLTATLITATSFTDNAVVAGNLCYQVSAFANHQEGSPSAPACVTYTPPPPPPPSAPLALTATEAQLPLVTGAAAYPLDEGSGQVVTDATGLGHAGRLGTKTTSDTADPLWTTGIAGGALRFDGANDYVMVADAADLHFDASFTIEAWVQRSATGKEDCILNKGDSGRRNYWMEFDTSSRIDFRWQNTAGKDHGTTTTLTFTDLGWHHVACVYDQAAGQDRIYYDGVLVRSAADSGTPATSTDPLYLGAKTTSGSIKAVFHGSLDLARVTPAVLYTTDFAPQTSFPQGGVHTVVQLAWQPPASGTATGYNVYRQNPDSTFSKMNPAPLTTTSWTDAAPPSFPACYRVTALDALAQESPPSDIACAGSAPAKAAPSIPDLATPQSRGLELAVGPNPFNPTTTIRFRLPAAGPVRCTIYDVRGERVATVVEGIRPAGEQSIAWRADHLASGAYFLVLEGAGLRERQRLILLK